MGETRLTFLSDSLRIDPNGQISTVPCRMTGTIHGFAFSLEGKPFDLRVFIHGKQRILLNNDSTLVVLEKSD